MCEILGCVMRIIVKRRNEEGSYVADVVDVVVVVVKGNGRWRRGWRCKSQGRCGMTPRWGFGGAGKSWRESLIEIRCMTPFYFPLHNVGCN